MQQVVKFKGKYPMLVTFPETKRPWHKPSYSRGRKGIYDCIGKALFMYHPESDTSDIMPINNEDYQWINSMQGRKQTERRQFRDGRSE